jgi:hypothetical protein
MLWIRNAVFIPFMSVARTIKTIVRKEIAGHLCHLFLIPHAAGIPFLFHAYKSMYLFGLSQRVGSQWDLPRRNYAQ